MTNAYDIVIVGGGIMGLSVAHAARSRGLSAVVIERGRCGSGASGTPLGALMPHLPGPADIRKDFQLAALASLGDHIAGLEHETGISAGYRQRGRILPIRARGFLEKMNRAADIAPAAWSEAVSGGRFEVLLDDAAAPFGKWLSPASASIGIAFETVSASVDPAAYIALLEASCRRSGSVVEQRTFASWDGGAARDEFGAVIAKGGHLVLAAGWETYELPECIAEDGLGLRRTGHGVKGHAILLRVEKSMAECPILYDNGLYIVPRGGTHCAIGATTDVEWSDIAADPSIGQRLHDRAKSLCPPLADCSIQQVWAGIRPRGADREPMIGRIPGRSDVFVATGGYKISFAIAHRAAEALVAEIAGVPCGITLPDAYRPDHDPDRRTVAG